MQDFWHKYYEKPLLLKLYLSKAKVKFQGLPGLSVTGTYFCKGDSKL